MRKAEVAKNDISKYFGIWKYSKETSVKNVKRMRKESEKKNKKIKN